MKVYRFISVTGTMRKMNIIITYIIFLLEIINSNIQVTTNILSEL